MHVCIFLKYQYAYVYMHIHVCIYIHCHTHRYINTCIYMYSYAYIYICSIYVYIYLYMHIFIYTYIYVYVYIHVHVYVYVYIDIYIYICMRKCLARESAIALSLRQVFGGTLGIRGLSGRSLGAWGNPEQIPGGPREVPGLWHLLRDMSLGDLGAAWDGRRWCLGALGGSLGGSSLLINALRGYQVNALVTFECIRLPTFLATPVHLF